MASDYEQFGAMLERAGVEHNTDAFVDRNEISVPDARAIFVFANSGALTSIESFPVVRG